MRLTVDTKICALDDGLIEIIKTKKEKKSILKKWIEPLRIVEQYKMSNIHIMKPPKEKRDRMGQKKNLNK